MPRPIGVVYTGHALGSLIQAGQGAKISFHHNLYAHQKGRLPRVGTEKPDRWDAENPGVRFVGSYNDFRNNVFYNWLSTAGTGAVGQPSSNNFVGNFYLAGPGGDDPAGRRASPSRTCPAARPSSTGPMAQRGSFTPATVRTPIRTATPTTASALTEQRLRLVAHPGIAPMRRSPYFGATDTAGDAFKRVLDHVGAQLEEPQRHRRPHRRRGASGGGADHGLE